MAIVIVSATWRIASGRESDGSGGLIDVSALIAPSLRVGRNIV